MISAKRIEELRTDLIETLGTSERAQWADNNGRDLLDTPSVALKVVEAAKIVEFSSMPPATIFADKIRALQPSEAEGGTK